MPSQRLSAADWWRALAVTALLLPTILLAMETTPGWSRKKLPRELTPEECYAIVAVLGVLAGPLIVERHRIVASLCGPICGIGGFFTVSLMLRNVSWTFKTFIMLAWVVGCLPGVGAFYMLKRACLFLTPLARSPDDGERFEDGAPRPED
jgi:hypothetical protein